MTRKWEINWPAVFFYMWTFIVMCVGFFIGRFSHTVPLLDVVSQLPWFFAAPVFFSFILNFRLLCFEVAVRIMIAFEALGFASVADWICVKWVMPLEKKNVKNSKTAKS